MPYQIKPMSGGFVVQDTKGKMFSNNPLTKKIATKQRIAIALNESAKTGKPASAYFVG
jgi:hypothetical protein